MEGRGRAQALGFGVGTLPWPPTDPSLGGGEKQLPHGASLHPSGDLGPLRVSLGCLGGEGGSVGTRFGGLLQRPTPGVPSFPLPGARTPEPPEQLPGTPPASTPLPTLPRARSPPDPLGTPQGEAPLLPLRQHLPQVRSGLWGWGGHRGRTAPQPRVLTLICHPWAPREPVERVNSPAGRWGRGRAGQAGAAPGLEGAGGGRAVGAQPGGSWNPGAGNPPKTSPGGCAPQPGLGAGHEALGGGLGGLQDAAGAPGAAGGPAAIQHLPPAPGGSGG